jgi:prepilin-type N-terminal cleavage/methylation domain-containing protein
VVNNDYIVIKFKKMKRRNIFEKAFTLVELLIVIALIAILSVAVLATINPIEQSNKARDAKFKNDAAEVLSAYERYYAAQNAYPWNIDNDASGSIDNDEPDTDENYIAFLSTDWRFGVLGYDGSSSTNNGQLISTSELKSAFTGKDSFDTSVVTAAGIEDAMYVYHSNDNNYVCFCPKANANRTGAMAAELKCLAKIDEAAIAVDNESFLYDVDEDVVAGTCDIPVDPKDTDYCDLGENSANLMCVPEGEIR